MYFVSDAVLKQIWNVFSFLFKHVKLFCQLPFEIVGAFRYRISAVLAVLLVLFYMRFIQPQRYMDVSRIADGAVPPRNMLVAIPPRTTLRRHGTLKLSYDGNGLATERLMLGFESS